MQKEMEIILWAMGGGFAGTWAMVFYFFSRVEERITSLEKHVDDIDRRLCRIEGALSRQDCCCLKSPQKEAQ